MAKRLRVKDETAVVVEREFESNSLWWIRYQELVFFIILSHLPIKDILNCRFVCHAWSEWTLHDYVWLHHVERITKFYPFFKQEFVDKSPKQHTLQGRYVEFDVPKKRRKPGGQRKVAPKRTRDLPKSGHWYAVKKFLNDKCAIHRALTIRALGAGFSDMKQGMIQLTRWQTKRCWFFTLINCVYDECALYRENYPYDHRESAKEFYVRVIINGVRHEVQLSSNLRRVILGYDEIYVDTSRTRHESAVALLEIFKTTNTVFW